MGLSSEGAEEKTLLPLCHTAICTGDFVTPYDHQDLGFLLTCEEASTLLWTPANAFPSEGYGLSQTLPAEVS